MAEGLSVIGIRGLRRENGHVKVFNVVRVALVQAIETLLASGEEASREVSCSEARQSSRVCVIIYTPDNRVSCRSIGVIREKIGQGRIACGNGTVRLGYILGLAGFTAVGD